MFGRGSDYLVWNLQSAIMQSFNFLGISIEFTNLIPSKLKRLLNNNLISELYAENMIVRNLAFLPMFMFKEYPVT